MPTSRTFWFLFAAFIFYIFANQTQLGWLYVVSALLCGILPAAWLAGLGVLRGISGDRAISKIRADGATIPFVFSESQVFHESDEITIALALNNTRRVPAVQVSVTETCPLAAADTPQRTIRMFVPMLPRTGVEFEYPLVIDRRGVYAFPALNLMTRAPFGFFRRSAPLNVPTACLVYPELRKLSHLPLLDKQPSAQSTFPRAGQGTEVLGVRPFRTGDSPRHVHWRSVARTGRLISKEFAEETQPGITLVLDRWCPLVPLPDTKHAPFEIAVKCAASIGEYALRRRYALYLCAGQDDIAVPGGMLTLDILLQYLARVPAQNKPTLPDLLARSPMQQYVAVLMAYPDVNAIEPMIALKHRGINVMAVLPDPTTFPIDGGESMQPIADSLRRSGIDVREIQFGDAWEDILSAQ